MTLDPPQQAGVPARASALHVAAAVIAATIFILDTVTPWDVAIAVLYVTVVLLAVNICSRRGLLLVAAGCIGLTLLSFAISHGPTYMAGPVARCGVAIASISIATFLALRIQATTQALRARTELLDLTHDTIFVRRMDDVITYWNHGAEELYGWTAEEAVGKVTRDLLQTGFPQDRDAIRAELLRAGRWEGELAHRTRRGQTVIVSSRWALMRDEAAQPVAILETNTDITERKRAEEKSRQHEKDLELIIDTIPAFTWSTRPDGSVHFISVQWDRAGYPVETLRHDPMDIVHPDDKAHVRRRWSASLRDKVPCEVEARVRSLDGAYRWFLHRAVPLRDAAGEVVEWYGSSTDIEELKKAEIQLRRVEENLRAAIDTIPGMVWFASPDDGGLEFVNARWAEMGLAFADVGGPKWWDVVHPDDRPAMQQAWAGALASGAPFENISRIRRADGTCRWLAIRGAPLRNEEGRIVRWYGVNTDIEDQKTAQEALLRSEAFLAEAQRLSRTGSFGMKMAALDLVWSDETYRLFGHDRSVTPTIALIRARIHPEDMATFDTFLARAAGGERNIEARHRLLMPEGTVKHVQVIAHATDTAPASLEYVGALMDVTASVEAEEALHRSQTELAHVTRVMTLGELTASIAHEVNQPLSGIVTNGEACLRWLGRAVPDVEEARLAVERMIADGRRASEVVRRLRALTRKDALPHEALDFGEVIEDAAQLIRRELLIHRTTLDTVFSPDLPPVSGDRVQLQQLVINLMMNGIQAMEGTPGGAREIAIGVRKDSEGILVRVRDSGPGIDPEAARQLFNAFFTTKPSGMGMGLSICRSIVEVHGGRIWAENDPAGGAVFQFTLPAVTADQEG